MEFNKKKCRPGWYGGACQFKKIKCAAKCENGGTCDSQTGTCNCKVDANGIPLFTGKSCNIHVCPNNCSNNGNCDYNTGICSCDSTWGGASCDTYKPLPCLNNCSGNNKGFCIKKTGKCSCHTGWKGEDCSEKVSVVNCPHNCSQAGTCKSDGTCICNFNRTGLDCSNFKNKTNPPTTTIILILLIIIIFSALIYYLFFHKDDYINFVRKKG